MANAFIPDEKRRHQYFPVNEDPPDYDVAAGSANDTDPIGTRRSHRTSSRTGRRRRSTSDLHATDDNDETSHASDDNSDTGHHADPHRANSEDSAEHEFYELEIDDEPEKEPIHVRLSKELQRITARVDKVLYTYINATVMRYIYGILLGLLVVGLVFLFGGSIPKLVVPKHYQEDALRVYINEELSASNIRKYSQQAASVLKKHQQVEAMFDTTDIASWVHSEFVKLGVARNAIDEFFVYYPRPTPDGNALEIRTSNGASYAADLVDKKGHLRAFITHGASGNVTAPLIFANYASPEDLEWLSTSGIDVRGAIVMFKRSRLADLATQIQASEVAGALGCIVYSSTDDYGEARGPVFPDGPFMPSDAAAHGDATMTWVQPGDPLTPGFPSTEGTRTVTLEDAQALLHIPAISVSARDAEHFLEFLEGHGLPLNSSWAVGGSPSFKCYTGANNADAPQVNLMNLLKNEYKHPIHDVLSEIDGGESDQVLIVGAPLSSPSAIGIMLEVARIYADLATKYEWKPRRSIIFAAWDLSEQNYLGSTEWVEAQLKSVRHQGLAYLNLGNAASLSGDLLVRATPSLSKALLQAMEHVQNKFGNATVAEDQGISMLASTAEPFGFSDSIAFEAHAGIAVADIGFADSQIYSGCLDSIECIDKYVDPDLADHVVLAKTFAMAILELVDERFIPLDIHAYARSIEAGVRSLSTKYPQLSFGGDLNKVMQQFDYKTNTAMDFQNEWRVAYVENKEMEVPLLSLRRSNWNYAVTLFHRNLLRSISWTTWFEHPVYGPSQKTNEKGQRTWLFPHIEDAVATGDMGKAQGTVEILGQSLLEAANAIQF